MTTNNTEKAKMNNLAAKLLEGAESQLPSALKEGESIQFTANGSKLIVSVVAEHAGLSIYVTLPDGDLGISISNAEIGSTDLDGLWQTITGANNIDNIDVNVPGTETDYERSGGDRVHQYDRTEEPPYYIT